MLESLVQIISGLEQTLANLGFKDWLALLDIALKTLISIGVGWIGWLTYKINRDKLKLDLYNRRLNVYSSVTAYYISLIHDANNTEAHHNLKLNFMNHSTESIFLFGEDSKVIETLDKVLAQFTKPIDNEKIASLLSQLSRDLVPWLDFKNISKSKPSKTQRIKTR
jgi:hypothetical protein